MKKKTVSAVLLLLCCLLLVGCQSHDSQEHSSSHETTTQTTTRNHSSKNQGNATASSSTNANESSVVKATKVDDKTTGVMLALLVYPDWLKNYIGTKCFCYCPLVKTKWAAAWPATVIWPLMVTRPVISTTRLMAMSLLTRFRYQAKMALPMVITKQRLSLLHG